MGHAPPSSSHEPPTELRAPLELGPESVGLSAGDELPFAYEPGAGFSPLVISFPHVGLEWPSALRPRPQVNFARNSDFEVNAIYPPLSTLPAASVRARFSRLVVDLNRADDDVSARLVPDHPAPRPRSQPGGGRSSGIENRGVVWSHAVGRIPVLRSLDFASLSKRIAAYHRPYYAALQVLLDARVDHFGYAILLDAHSMPSAVGHDLVLGTLDGASCHNWLQSQAELALNSQPGLRCSVNHPYRGGEIVRNFGRPSAGVHALQLEVSRGLYMDELRLQVHRDFLNHGSDDLQGSAGATSTSPPTQNRLAKAVQALVAALSDPAHARMLGG